MIDLHISIIELNHKRANETKRETMGRGKQRGWEGEDVEREGKREEERTKSMGVVSRGSLSMNSINSQQGLVGAVFIWLE